MNQEQGCVPDNKISCLFCFSTICFTLPEVKIHLWFIYTMQTTNSSMLGTEHSEFGTDMSTLKWHIPYFLYFRPPHHAPGCKPSFKPYIKTARTQLPFGAKQIPASLKSGLSLAVSVSRGVPVFLSEKVHHSSIYTFVHPFMNILWATGRPWSFVLPLGLLTLTNMIRVATQKGPQPQQSLMPPVQWAKWLSTEKQNHRWFVCMAHPQGSLKWFVT